MVGLHSSLRGRSLYIGETSDIELRVQRHKEGLHAAFTAARRPVRLVHCETHPTRSEAIKREPQLKGWTRAKKEALIAGDTKLLKRL